MMTDEEHLLDEFKPMAKSEFFTSLLLAFSLYILFVALDFVFDIENLEWTVKSIDWQLVVIILILPVTGLIFFIKRHKWGWAICLFYYMFMTVFFVATFFQELLRKDLNYFKITNNWKAYFLFLISVVSTSLLMSISVRDYFGIKPKKFRTTMFISLVISIIFIILTTTE